MCSRLVRPVRALIVNADDFGLASGVNDGIVEAHRAGIVTSGSLMVERPSAAEAAALARRHPALSVGLHFDDHRAAAGELDDPSWTAREFARQLERFRALVGAEPTHVDSHHHVHLDARRIATFKRLVAPLGVPLRGAGRVAYIGALLRPAPRRGHRARARRPTVAARSHRKPDRCRLQRARLPPGAGQRRPRFELPARARGRAPDADLAGPPPGDRGPGRPPRQLPRLPPIGSAPAWRPSTGSRTCSSMSRDTRWTASAPRSRADSNG